MKFLSNGKNKKKNILGKMLKKYNEDFFNLGLQGKSDLKGEGNVMCHPKTDPIAMKNEDP